MYSILSLLLVAIISFLWELFPSGGWTSMNESLTPIETPVEIKEEPVYDFDSDDSISRYVSPKRSFHNLAYEPGDLIALSGSHIWDQKKDSLIRREALVALQKLSDDFYKNTGKNLIVVSAYRSYKYQRNIEIKNPECIREGLCAKPGFSEHQTGLAIDIFEASNKEIFLSNSNYRKYFNWLSQNAHLYGFTNTYKKGIEIDAYHEEPWHWRYVGVDMAHEMYRKDVSFSEFFSSHH